MKIVIDIPHSVYENIINGTIETDGYFKANLRECFKNGTPLPKNHGRLIDENDLKTLYELEDRLWWSNAVKEFTDLPTIIEADRGE